MSAGKVVERVELKRLLAGRRAEGLRVALANGLFDLLHVGHLRYLEAARREADLLVVAGNRAQGFLVERGGNRLRGIHRDGAVAGPRAAQSHRPRR